MYTIGLFDENTEDKNPGVLKQLARQTGGLAYLPEDLTRVSNICSQIARDIRNQYTIGYNSPKLRRLRIPRDQSDRSRCQEPSVAGPIANRLLRVTVPHYGNRTAASPFSAISLSKCLTIRSRRSNIPSTCTGVRYGDRAA